MSDTAYLMISGAITAHRALEFVAVLSARFDRVITVQTPNATRLISPHDLRRIPNNHLVESYFDARILPRPTPGPVLFAPCNFNSLNKLAHGIADNLALSIVAEMIGFGQPVVVALSVNEPLFAHPVVRQSITTLTGWGVVVVEPQDAGQGLTMAPTEVVLKALFERLAGR
ncbi:MAG: flavoprotein [Candidatus Brachytrichaceae bacterium NZ_4S206]|jgi:phosphopantothenoylcysteine synthetase/decarboxylase